MKNLFLTFLFLLEVMQAGAQLPSCDGNRYKNPVFGAVDSVLDVKYGVNTTVNNVPQVLTMDIYQPHQDPAPTRPLIIFLHGGAFLSGDKHETRNLCLLFAHRGFVTATIDYRLIDVSVVDSITVADAIVKAMGDTKAAIRFFVEDAATQNQFRADTNYIFISGVSAGGIIASHVAYLDTTDNIPPYILNLINLNGGFKGNSSTNTLYPTPIKGVVNYSGALLQKGFISSGEPVLYSAHDQYDTIVPCNHGLTFSAHCPVYCDGSCAMQQEANIKGIDNALFLNPGYGHCAYFYTSPTADSVIHGTADFLYEVICHPVVAVSEHGSMQGMIQLFPNPATETINVIITENLNTGETIRLFDSMGLLLKEVEAKTSVQLDISGLPRGLYCIQMSNRYDHSELFIKR